MSGGITLPLYTVDAFSAVPFAGNPAAVCLDTTEQGLSDELMQNIAAEMNISETAFIRRLEPGDTFEKGNRFGLRWFTPSTEVPLCGHATLASSAALYFCVGNESEQIVFTTLSGELSACRNGNLISLDLPLNTPSKYEDLCDVSSLLKAVLGDRTVNDVHYSATAKKLLVRLDDSYTRSDLEELKPNPDALVSAHNTGKIVGVIVTLRNDGSARDASGTPYDFVSRYFAPWVGLSEDPVTGAAHTVLAGYWANQLNKRSLYARQCSPRGGELRLSVKNDGRLGVAGPATVLVRGSLTV